MIRVRTAVITKVVIGAILLSLALIQKVLAANVTIGMSDRFQKQSRYVGDNSTYKKIALRIVFDQSYRITHLGYWTYTYLDNTPHADYSVYLVSDLNGSPNLADILTSNISYDVRDNSFSTGGASRTEVPVPAYTVQANRPYWIVFNQHNSALNPTVSPFGLGQPPLDNFDFSYTTKYWDGTQWLDTGFYGCIWVKTESGLIYGQLKIRRDLFAYVGYDSQYNTSRCAGQEVFVQPGEYILDSLEVWLNNHPPSGQDKLYLTIQNLDNGTTIWSGSTFSPEDIPSSGRATYNFSDPKPVISVASKTKIRYSFSSSGTTSGSYDFNALEFYDSVHSWDGENSYATSTDSVGSWRPNPLKDLQAHLIAHNGSNNPPLPTDTTAPTITITSPTNGTTFTNPGIAVSGTATDNLGLSTVEIKVGDGNWQSATGTTSWSKAVTLATGINTIYARTTDTSGNTKETSLIVNYNPPFPATLDKKISVYPNPYIKGKSSGEKITFANLPSEVTILVYSLNGELVAELPSDFADKVEWNISNISSGIYLYAITSNKGISKGKLSIVK